MFNRVFKVLAVILVLAMLVLAGNMAILLTTAQPAKAAVPIERDRIKNVIYPCFGFPQILSGGERMTIEFDPRNQDWSKPLPELDEFIVTASPSNCSVGLVENLPVEYFSIGFSKHWPEYSSTAQPRARIYLLDVRVPVDVPEHLFDLTVIAKNNGTTSFQDGQPHCLQVVAQYKTELRVAQLTDVHVFGPEFTCLDSTKHERNWRHENYSETDGYGAAYYHKAIQQVNREKPDFAVFTGDYDYAQRWVSQHNYASDSGYKNSPWNGDYYEPYFEMDWFYQETLKLDVPVFIQLGNHDGYARYGILNLQEDYQASWRNLFGPAYFSFDYGKGAGRYHLTAANTNDWSQWDRRLYNLLLVVLPWKWQGQVEGGGDTFVKGWTQAREDAINENDFTGQLLWLKNDLEANASATMRILLMHHDPWRENGSGEMFDNDQYLGSLIGGKGAGRLSLIKLARLNNVALVLSGHDHSDNYGTQSWESGTPGTVQFANTTSTQLQGEENVYPGYRLVHINGPNVVNVGYQESAPGVPFYSWPTYKETSVGGSTDQEALSTPSIQSAWSRTDDQHVTCTVTNHLTGNAMTGGDQSGDIKGAGFEFNMPYLSDGYYYEATNGTIGEVFDNTETGTPTRRVYEVTSDLDHASGPSTPSVKAVSLNKSSSPDTTSPSCDDFLIDDGIAATDNINVELTNDAIDSGSSLLDMKMWNDSESPAQAEWQRYEPATSWKLERVAGSRTVHVLFRDRAMPGNTLEKSAAIMLVGIPPNISAPLPGPSRVGDTVTINGSNFGTQTEGDSVHLNGINAEVIGWNDTSITCKVPLGAANNASEDCPFTVTTDSGTTPEFNIDILPSVEWSQPDNGYNNNAAFHVDDIGGSGFYAASSPPQVKITDGVHEIAGTNVTIHSPESISCDLDLAGAAIGYYDVVVENPDHSTSTLSGGFRVSYPPPAPSTISPNEGINDGTVDATITGQYFRGGLDVLLVGAEDTVEGTNVQVGPGGDQATCSFDLTGAEPGPYDVYVENDDGETGVIAGGFTIEYPAPAVSGITPASGFVNGTVHVTDLTGSGFRAGATVRLAKGTSSIAATGVTVESASRISCTFDLTGAAAGDWDVVVQNDDGKSGELADGFTVAWASTHIDSVQPAEGKTGDKVTISGSNFSTGGAVTFGGLPATDILSWSGTKIECLVPAGASGSTPIVVTSAKGPSNAVPFLASEPSWYLAEGSTAWGFNSYISVANPNSRGVTVDVEYYTPTEQVSGGSYNVKAESQLTINPAETLGQTDFSTRVTCREGLTIACDRTMSWSGEIEGHTSIGVSGPSKAWFMPEGCSAFGFETWLLVQNPQNVTADCNITYMIEGQGAKVVKKSVPAHSRATYNMEDDIGERNASIMVQSDVPVIPERSMYRDSRREGSDSIGATGPSTDFYLSEGSTAWGFTTYVLVQNPNEQPARVTLSYMTKNGTHVEDPVTVAGKGRLTVKANDQVPNTDTSVRVHGDRPIVAERAMYWDNGTGEACHVSIGQPAPHREFYCPDGQAGSGYSTWTLVQNPNTTDVNIELTYMTDESGGNVTVKDVVPAGSRKTYDMSDSIASGRAAIKVACTTAGKKIMVERSMYWNDKGAGTESIGGYSD